MKLFCVLFKYLDCTFSTINFFSCYAYKQNIYIFLYIHVCVYDILQIDLINKNVPLTIP